MKNVISISGKPGLFKIVSQGKNLLILEDLITKKRMPAHSRDRLLSLGDIAMYTETEDMPLPAIFQKVYEINEGKPVDLKAIIEAKALKDEFAKAVPDFDRTRVHDSDIKKMYQWYNLLVEAGFTDFVEEEKEEAEPEAEA